jgi:hypothetical protein
MSEMTTKIAMAIPMSPSRDFGASLCASGVSTPQV